jgi:N6-adenosine-specific RNA methylase IME4
MNPEIMHSNIVIDPEFQALIPALQSEERTQLEANIVADGCRDPLVLWGRVLVDGHNRHEICTRLGLKFKVEQKDFDSREDVIVWMIDNQDGRRNISDFQKIELQLRKKAAISAKAKANQAHGQTAPGVTLPVNLPEALETREVIAKAAGVSGKTVSTVERIVETASPELLTALRTSRVSINAGSDIATLPKAQQVEIVARGTKEILQAAKEIRAARSEDRRNERIEKIVAISTGNAPVGSIAERYPVIYLDPPWRYDYAESDARTIENHYPTMSLDEIKAMDMSLVAFDDCIMFMWATSPKLADAFQVLDAWGFSYRTCAVWDKQKIGMGYYFRQQHELLLIAVKGQPPTPAPANRPSSVFSYPRGQHSAKPHEVYEVIEAMYPTLPKIEMFCRTPREGWGVWGNQSKAAE